MHSFRFLTLSALLALAGRPAAAQPRSAAPAPAAAAPADLAQALVLPAPPGVYAIVSLEALSPDRPTATGLAGVRVLRANAGSSSFREVGRVEQAGSLAEFRAQAGEEILAAIRQQQRLPSDEAAWAWVLAHPRLQDYGLLLLSLKFRAAMGTLALDAEAAGAPAGTQYTYRLVPTYAKGRKPRQADAPRDFTVTVGQRAPLPALRAQRAVGADSAVSLRWRAPRPAAVPDPARLTLFARVWRRGPGEAAFRVVADRVMTSANARGDSLLLSYRDEVRPEALYRYYAEPLNVVDNPGPASDTVAVLSVNPKGLPALNSLSARDTTDGIALRWPALPAKPYLLGLEIQRSRDGRGNFVRLDTVPATAGRYHDTRLLPDIMYHYRLRPLLRGGLATPGTASGAAFAAHRSGKGRTAPPQAPVQVQAVPEGTGVRLRWQPAAPDLNLAGYYVYRGTSRADSLLPVSPFLDARQLSFLDTAARNGRRAYVYAVRAVDKALQTSAYSAYVVARPNRAVAVSAPLGLAGFADGAVLRLRWEDAQRRDDNVVAYRLYRRRRPAAGAAAPAFEVLADNLPGPAYDDRAAPGASYEYAVTALDGLGTESPRSAPCAVAAPPAPGPRPPRQLNVRPVGGGLELSWSLPAAPPAQGYALYRRTREQAAPQRVARLPATARRYVDATAAPEVLYFYSLAALGAGQESGRSDEASGRR